MLLKDMGENWYVMGASGRPTVEYLKRAYDFKILGLVKS
jgi:hypothetical protein